RPVRLPSTPTPPERPKARPQGRVQIIAHPLYSPPEEDRHLCRQIEGKSANCWASRGYESSTRVGSVAPLRNTKEDDYYRNDSMK
ncbi:hypothetical protein QBC39DRAFT_255920, partial [Podospora conica]